MVSDSHSAFWRCTSKVRPLRCRAVIYPVEFGQLGRALFHSCPELGDIALDDGQHLTPDIGLDLLHRPQAGRFAKLRSDILCLHVEHAGQGVNLAAMIDDNVTALIAAR